MKKIELRESKTLLRVRKIKEDMAREAEKNPEYYQRLNGMGAKLLFTATVVLGSARLRRGELIDRAKSENFCSRQGPYLVS